MKAEKTQKEGASRAIQRKPERGKVYMEDDRPEVVRQAKFMNTIQLKGKNPSTILQQYKEHGLQRYIEDEEPLQGKFEKIQSNLIQFYRNKVIQMIDPSILPANYAGAMGTVLGVNATATRALGFAPGNSNVLRASLVNDSGVVDPINADIENQAHHIVEAHDPAAANSRLLLQGANIDIDSPINGVLLPTHETDDTGNATIHRGGHRGAYAAIVHRSLTHAINNAPGLVPPMNSTYAQRNAAQLAAGGPLWGPRSLWLNGVLVGRLNQIRTVLLSNMVPINNSVDAEATANGRGEISIYSIFHAAGII